LGAQQQNPHRRESDQQSICTFGTPVVQIGAASAMIRRAGAVPLIPDERCKGPANMQPLNLKAIARDATLHGDSKTLFHSLDLLGRLMPIASGRRDAFNDFCTELDELRLRGARRRPLRSVNPANSAQSPALDSAA
jgi:hypothetical protein